MASRKMPKKILCAGMHRSGSTWLFNAIRLIYICNNDSVYSYFFSEYDPKEGQNASIHVAKTHQFNDVLTTRDYDYIFTTCRDLRDLAASAVRKGMIDNRTRPIIKFLRKVLSEEYDAWSCYSDMEIVYEEMMENDIEIIKKIAQFLNIDVDPASVSRAVNSLPFPKKGEDYFRDTQLHYQHITSSTPDSYKLTLSKRTIRIIETKFSTWLFNHRYIPEKRTMFLPRFRIG